MKALIIQGSPRKKGHTEKLAECFSEKLESLGWETGSIWLGDCSIEPCIGCKHCQSIPSEFGCIKKDDTEAIYNKINEADLLVLATPIYSWYCTGSMKNLLDRHYMTTKYYGSAAANGKYCLVKDLSVVLLTTHGYPDQRANEPLEMGIKNLCKHCGWNYAGRLSARDTGIEEEFTEDKYNAKAEALAEEVTKLFHVKHQ